ncbi:MAG: plastocyanin/azurin family copper-binding protein [Actinomycetota bacterium]|nr:plastocyanin/azurin family copper-binding protein [Actinomycetota bacterium]
MKPEVRERAFLPLVMPLSVLVVMALVAWSISRVLLTVPELVAVLVALALAGYILLVAALVSNRPRIAPRTIGVGLAIGVVGLVGAGLVADAAGMRPLHEGRAAGGDAESGENEGEDGGGGVPPGALEFVGTDELVFEQAPRTAPAGEQTFVLTSEGGLRHNVVIDEVSSQPIVEADGGQTEQGTAELEPGTLTYYCSVPGHREAGMEGELDVS